MKSRTIKILLYILISVTFLPYVASLITLNVSLLYKLEILSLILWYGTSSMIPLAMGELSTSLLFWVYHLVLVGIPIGSDLVYRLTGITPRMWWYGMKHLMPVNWYVQGVLTKHYYSFLSTLGLLIMPGLILFVVIYWNKMHITSLMRGEKA